MAYENKIMAIHWMWKKRLVSIIISQNMMMSISLAASESDTLFSLSLEELMHIEVTTTSKYKEKINDSPANIYVFKREQIQERGLRNVEDLLQTLPGVHLQKYSTIGPYNTVAFRGAMGNNKFLILQDGVRLSSPAGENTAIGNNYPLYYAKQVEVLMGPASVVYGADAFMGVINIITQDNDDEDLVEASLSAGTNGYGYGYAQLHQNFSQDAYLNMGIQGFQSQDYKFSGDYPELYNDPAKNYDFAKSKDFQFYARYRINAQWQFGLNHASHSNSNDFTTKPSFSQFDSGATEKIKQTTLYGKFTSRIGDDLRSSTLLTLMNYELDKNSYFNNLFSGGSPGYKYARTNRVSINQDFEYKLDKQHLLSGGLVYDYIDIIPRGPDLPSPYDTSKGPNDQNFVYPNTTLPIEFFATDYQNVGVYMQDNWQIDSQWRLVTGLRYDDNSLYGDSTNPRLSLIHKYNEYNLFKLLYGHAFLAPSSTQAFLSFGNFTGAQNGAGEWLGSPVLPFQVPNPDLKPERIKTLEFNYEHWFDKNTHMKFAPFYSQIEDVIFRKGDTVPDQAIAGAYLQKTNKFDNVGTSEIYGIDLSIDNQLESGKWLYKNWGNFSYVDGSLTNNGLKTELPMVSQYRMTAGTTISYNKTYLLTPMIYWVGSSSSNQSDPADNSKMIHVPTYFLMDLHAEAKLTKNFSFKLDVYNLLDNTYVNAPFPGGFVALNRAPQTGRLSAISVYFKF